jgi:pimeloyl-ACP methyl ester carboxylesterase
MPFAHSQGLTIFFEELGSGPTVVLGHSFLCSRAMWREQLPLLSRRFRVITPDLRGHGKSGRVDHPFSLYDAVSDVIAVLDILGIDRAVWCGLSIGGMVALRAALSHPQRVSGLMLLDTDAGAESSLRKLKYRAMGVGARLVGLKPFLPSVARLMFGTTTRRHNRALVQEWKAEFSALHVGSVLHVLEALLQRDSVLPHLEQITVPALILVGEEDASLPPAFSERMHARLPNSTLVRIPAAGHLSALEQPGLVTDAMLRFLGAHAY